ncbi:aspartate carbamoyltransferase, partial [Candidatus Micrarchaeota archaeon]|nr:aspartate carbamoyltransferase [Candidatus Micrarchaeota archaeon]
SPEGKKVAFVGDLKYGRTVHSFAQLLLLFNAELFFVSPPQLQMPEEYKEMFVKKGANFVETQSIDDILPIADAVYVTRIQRERFDNPAEYSEVKDAFIITRREVEKMKHKSVVMHPLPRVSEITSDVDADRRAVYFKQAENGLYIRMALLEKILKE